MPLVSTSYLSELTGRDRRTVKKLLADLRPIEQGRAHLYESSEALELIYSPFGKRSQSDTDLNLEEENARLACARADAQELKNEITRREQAPVWLLTLALSRVASQAAAILDSTKLNIRKRYPDVSNTLLEQIEGEITEARNAIAGVEIDLSETDE